MVHPFSPVLLDAHNPGPMTGAGNNTYLVAAADGHAVLIDAGVGHPDHLRALERALGDERSTLAMVAVTHSHPDHASGTQAIAAAHRMAVCAKYPGPDDHTYGRVEWRPLRDGEQIGFGKATLTVIHTPGHSPDHIALWHEPTGALFTGDLIVSGGSVMIHASRGGNLIEYLASLKRILELEPRRLFPAHGPRVDDPRALVRAHLEHRRARERQVLAALEADRRTVEAIVESIYHGVEPALREAARETVLAHLDKLRTEGIAADRDGSWVLL